MLRRNRHKGFTDTQRESRMHIGGHKGKSCGKSDQKKATTINNKTEKEDMSKMFEGVFQCLKRVDCTLQKRSIDYIRFYRIRDYDFTVLLYIQRNLHLKMSVEYIIYQTVVLQKAALRNMFQCIY